ncbi:MAG: PstA family ABC transporter permease [Thermoplasmata archaeon]|nr:ABC transporter permease subunit [Thermoplasmata archaeon]
MATNEGPNERIDPADDLRRGETWGLRWRTGFDRWMGLLLPLLFAVAILPIADLVYFISAKAVPTLSWHVVTSYSDYQAHDTLGVPLMTTFLFMALATSIAVVLGLFGGIAAAEFLPERAAGWVRMSANLLAGMPSVIVGYFGYFAFVLYFGWGLSFIAGVFTLAFFMTPYVYRTADLAFSSIPRPIREAAYGSGAKPVQYILRVGAPIAFPQILTGVFLAMAIGVGETAPIILTTQPGLLVPSTVFQPAVFMTYLIWTGFSQPAGSVALTLAYQAAFFIIVVVLALNIVVRVVAGRFRKRLQGLYQ